MNCILRYKIHYTEFFLCPIHAVTLYHLSVLVTPRLHPERTILLVLTKAHLLILDELSYRYFNRHQSELLFEVLSKKITE